MFSQTCVLAVLESMGQEGLRRHAYTVANFYRKQRDACIAAAEKHLTGKRTFQSTVPVLLFCWGSVYGNGLQRLMR